MSFSCSATCLRNRASSVRAAGVNGTSFRAAAAAFVGDPPPQQAFVDPSLAGHFGDRAPGIDDPVSGLELVLDRERRPGFHVLNVGVRRETVEVDSGGNRSNEPAAVRSRSQGFSLS